MSSELLGISSEFLGIPRNSSEFLEIPQNSGKVNNAGTPPKGGDTGRGNIIRMPNGFKYNRRITFLNRCLEKFLPFPFPLIAFSLPSSRILLHPRNSSKFIEIPRNSSKFLEIPRNSSEFLEIPRNSSKFLGIPRNFSEFLGNSLNSSSFEEFR